jgi:hypothetical protein
MKLVDSGKPTYWAVFCPQNSSRDDLYEWFYTRGYDLSQPLIIIESIDVVDPLAMEAFALNAMPKGNLQKASDSFLKAQGIDAHALKMEYLGDKAAIKYYDLFYNKNTKLIYILDKAGKIVTYTHMYIK